MKEALRCFLKYINYAISIINTILGTLIIFAIYRKRGLPLSNEKKGKCAICGNGPSLRAILDSGAKEFEGSDVFVVNAFATDPAFFIIKPRHYVIVDPGAFENSDHLSVVKLQNNLIAAIKKLDWKMTIYVSSYVRSSYLIRRIKEVCNENVDIMYVNTTPVDGPSFFRNFIIKTGLGMPKSWNVLNAASVIAINLGYKSIGLFGADHSWIKDIYVDEQNRLCARNTHCYSKDNKTANDDSYIMEKGALELGLLSFAMCLKSYRYIKDYAEKHNVQIRNCTKGSYIDVFDFE